MGSATAQTCEGGHCVAPDGLVLLQRDARATLQRSSLSSGVPELLAIKAKCGNTRYKFSCSGKDYDEWLEKNARDLLAADKEATGLPVQRSVAFFGDSLLRQVAETLLCQHRDEISLWEPTVNAAVDHPREGDQLGAFEFSATCDGCGGSTVGADGIPVCEIEDGHACTDELARATFKSGAKMYTVLNHPWLYQGTKGFEKILARLDLKLDKLDAIVLGDWHTKAWASDIFGKTSWGSGPYEVFEVEDIVKFFKAQGFRGEFIMGQSSSLYAVNKYVTSDEWQQRLKNLQQQQFSITQLSVPHRPDGISKGSKCKINGCADEPLGEHECMPGNPEWHALELTKMLSPSHL